MEFAFLRLVFQKTTISMKASLSWLKATSSIRVRDKHRSIFSILRKQHLDSNQISDLQWWTLGATSDSRKHLEKDGAAREALFCGNLPFHGATFAR